MTRTKTKPRATARRFAGRIVVKLPTGECISFPDAVSPQVQNAAYRARHCQGSVTSADLFHLAACAEFLARLSSPSHTTLGYVMAKMRSIRAAVKDVDVEP